MNTKTPFYKGISAFTVAAVCLTQIFFEQPALAQMPETPRALKAAAAFQIEIPPELGRIETITSGTGPVFIHIQEAHGDYESQKKIEALLHYLKKQYGVKLVLVEGSAAQLHPEILNFFPADPAATNKVLDALAREAWAKGTESFLVSDKETAAYGIETFGSYLKNARQFQTILGRRNETADFIDALQSRMQQLASVLLNKNLRSFLRRRQSYDEKELPLAEWVEALKGEARKTLKIDLTDPLYQLDWPMFLRLSKLQEFETALDFKSLPAERRRFLKSIRRFCPGLIYQKIEALLSLPLSRNNLSDPETGMLIESMVSYLPANFNYAAYPNLNRFIGHLIMQSELKGALLAAEIEKLAAQTAEALTENPVEKEFLDLAADYRAIRKIFDLELSTEDYENFSSAEARERLLPSHLHQRLSSFEKTNRGESLAAMDAMFTQIMEFYAGAKNRDGQMAGHILERMRQTGETKAVILTGGFHSKGLGDFLRAHNANYALISPVIEGLAHRDEYFKTFLETSFDSAGHSAVMRPWLADYKNFPWSPVFDQARAAAVNRFKPENTILQTRAGVHEPDLTEKETRHRTAPALPESFYDFAPGGPIAFVARSEMRFLNNGIFISAGIFFSRLARPFVEFIKWYGACLRETPSLSQVADEEWIRWWKEAPTEEVARKMEQTLRKGEKLFSRFKTRIDSLGNRGTRGYERRREDAQTVLFDEILPVLRHQDFILDILKNRRAQNDGWGATIAAFDSLFQEARKKYYGYESLIGRSLPLPQRLAGQLPVSVTHDLKVALEEARQLFSKLKKFGTWFKWLQKSDKEFFIGKIVPAFLDLKTIAELLEERGLQHGGLTGAIAEFSPLYEKARARTGVDFSQAYAASNKKYEELYAREKAKFGVPTTLQEFIPRRQEKSPWLEKIEAALSRIPVKSPPEDTSVPPKSPPVETPKSDGGGNYYLIRILQRAIDQDMEAARKLDGREEASVTKETLFAQIKKNLEKLNEALQGLRVEAAQNSARASTQTVSQRVQQVYRNNQRAYLLESSDAARLVLKLERARIEYQNRLDALPSRAISAKKALLATIEEIVKMKNIASQLRAYEAQNSAPDTNGVLRLAAEINDRRSQRSNPGKAARRRQKYLSERTRIEALAAPPIIGAIPDKQLLQLAREHEANRLKELSNELERIRRQQKLARDLEQGANMSQDSAGIKYQDTLALRRSYAEDWARRPYTSEPSWRFVDGWAQKDGTEESPPRQSEDEDSGSYAGKSYWQRQYGERDRAIEDYLNRAQMTFEALQKRRGLLNHRRIVAQNTREKIEGKLRQAEFSLRLVSVRRNLAAAFLDDGDVDSAAHEWKAADAALRHMGGQQTELSIEVERHQRVMDTRQKLLRAGLEWAEKDAGELTAIGRPLFSGEEREPAMAGALARLNRMLPGDEKKETKMRRLFNKLLRLSHAAQPLTQSKREISKLLKALKHKQSLKALADHQSYLAALLAQTSELDFSLYAEAKELAEKLRKFADRTAAWDEAIPESVGPAYDLGQKLAAFTIKLRQAFEKWIEEESPHSEWMDGQVRAMNGRVHDAREIIDAVTDGERTLREKIEMAGSLQSSVMSAALEVQTLRSQWTAIANGQAAEIGKKDGSQAAHALLQKAETALRIKLEKARQAAAGFDQLGVPKNERVLAALRQIKKDNETAERILASARVQVINQEAELLLARIPEPAALADLYHKNPAAVLARLEEADAAIAFLALLEPQARVADQNLIAGYQNITYVPSDVLCNVDRLHNDAQQRRAQGQIVLDLLKTATRLHVRAVMITHLPAGVASVPEIKSLEKLRGGLESIGSELAERGMINHPAVAGAIKAVQTGIAARQAFLRARAEKEKEWQDVRKHAALLYKNMLDNRRQVHGVAAIVAVLDSAPGSLRGMFAQSKDALVRLRGLALAAHRLNGRLIKLEMTDETALAGILDEVRQAADPADRQIQRARRAVELLTQAKTVSEQAAVLSESMPSPLAVAALFNRQGEKAFAVVRRMVQEQESQFEQLQHRLDNLQQKIEAEMFKKENLVDEALQREQKKTAAAKDRLVAAGREVEAAIDVISSITQAAVRTEILFRQLRTLNPKRIDGFFKQGGFKLVADQMRQREQNFKRDYRKALQEHHIAEALQDARRWGILEIPALAAPFKLIDAAPARFAAFVSPLLDRAARRQTASDLLDEARRYKQTVLALTEQEKIRDEYLQQGGSAGAHSLVQEARDILTDQIKTRAQRAREALAPDADLQPEVAREFEQIINSANQAIEDAGNQISKSEADSRQAAQEAATKTKNLRLQITAQLGRAGDLFAEIDRAFLKPGGSLNAWELITRARVAAERMSVHLTRIRVEASRLPEKTTTLQSLMQAEKNRRAIRYLLQAAAKHLLELEEKSRFAALTAALQASVRQQVIERIFAEGGQQFGFLKRIYLESGSSQARELLEKAQALAGPNRANELPRGSTGFRADFTVAAEEENRFPKVKRQGHEAAIQENWQVASVLLQQAAREVERLKQQSRAESVQAASSSGKLHDEIEAALGDPTQPLIHIRDIYLKQGAAAARNTVRELEIKAHGFIPLGVTAVTAARRLPEQTVLDNRRKIANDRLAIRQQIREARRMIAVMENQSVQVSARTEQAAEYLAKRIQSDLKRVISHYLDETKGAAVAESDIAAAEKSAENFNRLLGTAQMAWEQLQYAYGEIFVWFDLQKIKQHQAAVRQALTDARQALENTKNASRVIAFLADQDASRLYALSIPSFGDKSDQFAHVRRIFFSEGSAAAHEHVRRIQIASEAFDGYVTDSEREKNRLPEQLIIDQHNRVAAYRTRVAAQSRIAFNLIESFEATVEQQAAAAGVESAAALRRLNQTLITVQDIIDQQGPLAQAQNAVKQAREQLAIILDQQQRIVDLAGIFNSERVLAANGQAAQNAINANSAIANAEGRIAKEIWSIHLQSSQDMAAAEQIAGEIKQEVEGQSVAVYFSQGSAAAGGRVAEGEKRAADIELLESNAARRLRRLDDDTTRTYDGRIRKAREDLAALFANERAQIERLRAQSAASAEDAQQAAQTIFNAAANALEHLGGSFSRGKADVVLAVLREIKMKVLAGHLANAERAGHELDRPNLPQIIAIQNLQNQLDALLEGGQSALTLWKLIQRITLTANNLLRTGDRTTAVLSAAAWLRFETFKLEADAINAQVRSPTAAQVLPHYIQTGTQLLVIMQQDAQRLADNRDLDQYEGLFRGFAAAISGWSSFWRVHQMRQIVVQLENGRTWLTELLNASEAAFGDRQLASNFAQRRDALREKIENRLRAVNRWLKFLALFMPKREAQFPVILKKRPVSIAEDINQTIPQPAELVTPFVPAAAAGNKDEFIASPATLAGVIGDDALPVASSPARASAPVAKSSPTLRHPDWRVLSGIAAAVAVVAAVWLIPSLQHRSKDIKAPSAVLTATSETQNPEANATNENNPRMGIRFTQTAPQPAQSPAAEPAGFAASNTVASNAADRQTGSAVAGKTGEENSFSIGRFWINIFWKLGVLLIIVGAASLLRLRRAKPQTAKRVVSGTAAIQPPADSGLTKAGTIAEAANIFPQLPVKASKTAPAIGEPQSNPVAKKNAPLLLTAGAGGITGAVENTSDAWMQIFEQQVLPLILSGNNSAPLLLMPGASNEASAALGFALNTGFQGSSTFTHGHVPQNNPLQNRTADNSGDILAQQIDAFLRAGRKEPSQSNAPESFWPQAIQFLSGKPAASPSDPMFLTERPAPLLLTAGPIGRIAETVITVQAERFNQNWEEVEKWQMRQPKPESIEAETETTGFSEADIFNNMKPSRLAWQKKSKPRTRIVPGEMPEQPFEHISRQAQTGVGGISSAAATGLSAALVTDTASEQDITGETAVSPRTHWRDNHSRTITNAEKKDHVKLTHKDWRAAKKVLRQPVVGLVDTERQIIEQTIHRELAAAAKAQDAVTAQKAISTALALVPAVSAHLWPVIMMELNRADAAVSKRFGTPLMLTDRERQVATDENVASTVVEQPGSMDEQLKDTAAEEIKLQPVRIAVSEEAEPAKTARPKIILTGSIAALLPPVVSAATGKRPKKAQLRKGKSTAPKMQTAGARVAVTEMPGVDSAVPIITAGPVAPTAIILESDLFTAQPADDESNEVGIFAEIKAQRLIATRRLMLNDLSVSPAVRAQAATQIPAAAFARDTLLPKLLERLIEQLLPDSGERLLLENRQREARALAADPAELDVQSEDAVAPVKTKRPKFILTGSIAALLPRSVRVTTDATPASEQTVEFFTENSVSDAVQPVAVTSDLDVQLPQAGATAAEIATVVPPSVSNPEFILAGPIAVPSLKLSAHNFYFVPVGFYDLGTRLAAAATGGVIAGTAVVMEEKGSSTEKPADSKKPFVLSPNDLEQDLFTSPTRDNEYQFAQSADFLGALVRKGMPSNLVRGNFSAAPNSPAGEDESAQTGGTDRVIVYPDMHAAAAQTEESPETAGLDAEQEDGGKAAVSPVPAAAAQKGRGRKWILPASIAAGLTLAAGLAVWSFILPARVPTLAKVTQSTEESDEDKKLVEMINGQIPKISAAVKDLQANFVELDTQISKGKKTIGQIEKLTEQVQAELARLEKMPDKIKTNEWKAQLKSKFGLLERRQEDLTQNVNVSETQLAALKKQRDAWNIQIEMFKTIIEMKPGDRPRALQQLQFAYLNLQRARDFHDRQPRYLPATFSPESNQSSNSPNEKFEKLLGEFKELKIALGKAEEVRKKALQDMLERNQRALENLAQSGEAAQGAIIETEIYLASLKQISFSKPLALWTSSTTVTDPAAHEKINIAPENPEVNIATHPPVLDMPPTNLSEPLKPSVASAPLPETTALPEMGGEEQLMLQALPPAQPASTAPFASGTGVDLHGPTNVDAELAKPAVALSMPSSTVAAPSAAPAAALETQSASPSAQTDSSAAVNSGGQTNTGRGIPVVPVAVTIAPLAPFLISGTLWGIMGALAVLMLAFSGWLLLRLRPKTVSAVPSSVAAPSAAPGVGWRFSWFRKSAPKPLQPAPTAVPPKTGIAAPGPARTAPATKKTSALPAKLNTAPPASAVLPVKKAKTGADVKNPIPTPTPGASTTNIVSPPSAASLGPPERQTAAAAGHSETSPPPGKSADAKNTDDSPPIPVVPSGAKEKASAVPAIAVPIPVVLPDVAATSHAAEEKPANAGTNASHPAETHALKPASADSILSPVRFRLPRWVTPVAAAAGIVAGLFLLHKTHQEKSGAGSKTAMTLPAKDSTPETEVQLRDDSLPANVASPAPAATGNQNLAATPQPPTMVLAEVNLNDLTLRPVPVSPITFTFGSARPTADMTNIFAPAPKMSPFDFSEPFVPAALALNLPDTTNLHLPEISFDHLTPYTTPLSPMPFAFDVARPAADMTNIFASAPEMLPLDFFAPSATTALALNLPDTTNLNLPKVNFDDLTLRPVPVLPITFTLGLARPAADMTNIFAPVPEMLPLDFFAPSATTALTLNLPDTTNLNLPKVNLDDLNPLLKPTDAGLPGVVFPSETMLSSTQPQATPGVVPETPGVAGLEVASALVLNSPTVPQPESMITLTVPEMSRFAFSAERIELGLTPVPLLKLTDAGLPREVNPPDNLTSGAAPASAVKVKPPFRATVSVLPVPVAIKFALTPPGQRSENLPAAPDSQITSAQTEKKNASHAAVSQSPQERGGSTVVATPKESNQSAEAEATKVQKPAVTVKAADKSVIAEKVKSPAGGKTEKSKTQGQAKAGKNAQPKIEIKRALLTRALQENSQGLDVFAAEAALQALNPANTRLIGEADGDFDGRLARASDTFAHNWNLEHPGQPRLILNGRIEPQKFARIWESLTPQQVHALQAKVDNQNYDHVKGGEAVKQARAAHNKIAKTESMPAAKMIAAVSTVGDITNTGHAEEMFAASGDDTNTAKKSLQTEPDSKETASTPSASQVPAPSTVVKTDPVSPPAAASAVGVQKEATPAKVAAGPIAPKPTLTQPVQHTLPKVGEKVITAAKPGVSQHVTGKTAKASSSPQKILQARLTRTINPGDKGLDVYSIQAFFYTQSDFYRNLVGKPTGKADQQFKKTVLTWKTNWNRTNLRPGKKPLEMTPSLDQATYATIRRSLDDTQVYKMNQLYARENWKAIPGGMHVIRALKKRNQEKAHTVSSAVKLAADSTVGDITNTGNDEVLFAASDDDVNSQEETVQTATDLDEPVFIAQNTVSVELTPAADLPVAPEAPIVMDAPGHSTAAAALSAPALAFNLQTVPQSESTVKLPVAKKPQLAFSAAPVEPGLSPTDVGLPKGVNNPPDNSASGAAPSMPSAPATQEVPTPAPAIDSTPSTPEMPAAAPSATITPSPNFAPLVVSTPSVPKTPAVVTSITPTAPAPAAKSLAPVLQPPANEMSPTNTPAGTAVDSGIGQFQTLLPEASRDQAVSGNLTEAHPIPRNMPQVLDSDHETTPHELAAPTANQPRPDIAAAYVPKEEKAHVQAATAMTNAINELIAKGELPLMASNGSGGQRMSPSARRHLGDLLKDSRRVKGDKKSPSNKPKADSKSADNKKANNKSKAKTVKVEKKTTIVTKNKVGKNKTANNGIKDYSLVTPNMRGALLEHVPFPPQYFKRTVGGTRINASRDGGKRVHNGRDGVMPIGVPLFASLKNPWIRYAGTMGGYGNIVIIRGWGLDGKLRDFPRGHVGKMKFLTNNQFVPFARAQHVKSSTVVAYSGRSGIKNDAPHTHDESWLVKGGVNGEGWRLGSTGRDFRLENIDWIYENAVDWNGKGGYASNSLEAKKETIGRGFRNAGIVGIAAAGFIATAPAEKNAAKNVNSRAPATDILDQALAAAGLSIPSSSQAAPARAAKIIAGLNVRDLTAHIPFIAPVPDARGFGINPASPPAFHPANSKEEVSYKIALKVNAGLAMQALQDALRQNNLTWPRPGTPERKALVKIFLQMPQEAKPVSQQSSFAQADAEQRRRVATQIFSALKSASSSQASSTNLWPALARLNNLPETAVFKPHKAGLSKTSVFKGKKTIAGKKNLAKKLSEKKHGKPIKENIRSKPKVASSLTARRSEFRAAPALIDEIISGSGDIVRRVYLGGLILLEHLKKLNARADAPALLRALRLNLGLALPEALASVDRKNIVGDTYRDKNAQPRISSAALDRLIKRAEFSGISGGQFIFDDRHTEQFKKNPAALFNLLAVLRHLQSLGRVKPAVTFVGNRREFFDSLRKIFQNRNGLSAVEKQEMAGLLPEPGAEAATPFGNLIAFIDEKDLTAYLDAAAKTEGVVFLHSLNSAPPIPGIANFYLEPGAHSSADLAVLLSGVAVGGLAAAAHIRGLKELEKIRKELTGPVLDNLFPRAAIEFKSGGFRFVNFEDYLLALLLENSAAGFFERSV